MTGITHTIIVKLPVYPGWRMWAWRLLRIRLPLWNVWEADVTDVQATAISPEEHVEKLTVTHPRLILKHVSKRKAEAAA